MGTGSPPDDPEIFDRFHLSLFNDIVPKLVTRSCVPAVNGSLFCGILKLKCSGPHWCDGTGVYGIPLNRYRTHTLVLEPVHQKIVIIIVTGPSYEVVAIIKSI